VIDSLITYYAHDMIMENKSTIKIAAFLFTSGLGISFLVFLNAAQPFVLRQITRTPNNDVAKVSRYGLLCSFLCQAVRERDLADELPSYIII
jgi:hypothetical protein